MADSDQWYTHEFPRIFQASRSGLEGRIASAKTAAQPNPNIVNELAQELAKLNKSLADANNKLPTYDQRQYGLQIKALEAIIEELREASKPKTKFAFRRAAPLENSQRPSIVATPVKIATVSSNKPQHTLLSSLSHRYISLTDLPTSGQQSSELAISGLDHCIVNLTSSTRQNDDIIRFSAVHVENLTHTVLILPMINGSILLHNLTSCVVAAGCHQFRMHDSRQVQVYLSITSHPVIEHCSEIGFAAYPDILKQLQPVNGDSKHLAVQDFSHIRSSPSPHWSALSNDSVIESWPMEEIHGKERVEEALSVLL